MDKPDKDPPSEEAPVPEPEPEPEQPGPEKEPEPEKEPDSEKEPEPEKEPDSEQDAAASAEDQRETADLPIVPPQEADPRPVVLCIDADLDNLELIKRVLETTGRYRLICVTDGIRGVELVKRDHPNLVLMDIDLPLVDGLEIFRRIRNHSATEKIPVAAITAAVMKGERGRCRNAGFDAFVEKPFDIHELRQLVTWLISGDTMPPRRPSADWPTLPAGSQKKA